MPREEFYSKADFDEITDAAGEFYGGRITIGEAGGVLYWPKAYTINRRINNYVNLPPVETMAQAKDAYIRYLRQFIEFERREIGKGPLMNVESGLVFKYHAEAGIDILCQEMMPGDPHLMTAALRGAARAYGKPWGIHVAMHAYGGVSLPDELWQRRWRMSLLYSYLSGAEFIWPESGHYRAHNRQNGKKFGFNTKEMKRVRRTLRMLHQLSRIHTRPERGPMVSLGVVHGNLDGTPGLWNRYAWGQYGDRKWREGPAERGWRLVDTFHRKEDCFNPYVQGKLDFSGNPPYGQYDVVPVEAPLKIMKRYSCLLFVGWNTMTSEIYEKLKEYVESGGHLVMYLPHLSTHTDRARAIKLFRNGDFRDLFGVRVMGKVKSDVIGVKCLANSSLRAYRFPLWRINTDPRFLGEITAARLQLTTARVISGYDDYYRTTPEELVKRPLLLEKSAGRGKAFLVAAWQYPADEGILPFTEDLLRAVLAGEQGKVRLLSTDRVRYAVYEGRAPGSARAFRVIYLLNTDLNCAASARLWLAGKSTEEISIPCADMRIAYCCGNLLLIPSDARVEMKRWNQTARGCSFEFFSVCDQEMGIHNLSKKKAKIIVNGASASCPAGSRLKVRLPRTVDPSRRKFFDRDFLDEPRVSCGNLYPFPY